MAQHLEIERKFLVKQPPPGWKRSASSQIVQGYFPMERRHLEIRLRRKGSKHFITIKEGRGGRRLEEEIEIPEPKFRSLWPLTCAARIAKRRYRIPCQGHTIEMDVYQGPHRGLIMADIEFDSARGSRSFQPPGLAGTRNYRQPAIRQ